MWRSKKEIEEENWELTKTILEQQIKINDYERIINNIGLELAKLEDIGLKLNVKKREGKT